MDKQENLVEKAIPRNKNTVECVSCGWQGDRNATDSGHCPECGDECRSLSEIYGDVDVKHDISTDTWVACYPDDRCERPQIGRVKDAYNDAFGNRGLLLDIVIYSHTGQRIGRESPALGGPRGFEPACSAEFWEPIEEPDFKWLADKFFYGRHLCRLRKDRDDSPPLE